MINTGNIITQGTQVFTPIFTRLRELAQEFIPYFIYIALGALGISLLWNAVKYIMNYLKYKSEGPFAFREGSKRNPEVYYNQKQHDRDEEHGQLKPEREYYKK